MTITTDHSEDPPTEPANTVRAIREELKLTQRQLADRLGVHTHSVSNWETGGSTPNRAKLEAIEQLLAAYREKHVGDRSNASYYVMTYTTHRPSGVLGTLRSLKRRVDAMATELEQLIEELEQTATSTALPLPKGTQA
jgi:transcriptional regulator with XRE-family HTH domain